MKATLFMATSINGYITGKNDDTEWIKDTEILYKIIAEKGACVMGRRTYDEAKKYNAFPYKGALNVVITHDQKLIKQTTNQSIFTDIDPAGVIKLLESKGHKEMIVVGGGHINSQFLLAGLIDEIIIDVHPIIIDNGIRLFEDIFTRTNLELLESRMLRDGIVQNKYKIIK